ncbi:MAG: hypothetical protein V2G42_06870 [bacterium JZ-2024 1]
MRRIICRLTLSLAVVFSLLASLPLLAHEGEIQGLGGATATEEVEPGPDEMGYSETSAVEPGEEALFVMPPLAEGLFHHLHNKLVHFPYGLALAALLLYLMSLKDPKFGEGARWVVLLAALVAIPIYFTGSSQEEALEETAKEWLVEVHEKIGITTAITLWIWAVMGWLKPTQRVAWIWGIVVLGFLAAAGYYGGLVAHG